MVDVDVEVDVDVDVGVDDRDSFRAESEVEPGSVSEGRVMSPPQRSGDTHPALCRLSFFDGRAERRNAPLSPLSPGRT